MRLLLAYFGFALIYFYNFLTGCRFSMVMEETANYAVAAKSEATLLKSLTFAVAMSFHSVLEGFALGVQVLSTFAST